MKSTKILLITMIISITAMISTYGEETEYESMLIVPDETVEENDGMEGIDDITVTGEMEETEGLIVDPDCLYDGYDETQEAESGNYQAQDPTTLEMNPAIAEETVLSDGTAAVPDNIISGSGTTYAPTWEDTSSRDFLLSAASESFDASSYFGTQLSGASYTLYSHRVQYYANDRNTSSYIDTDMGTASSGYLFSYTGKYKIVDGYLEYDISEESSEVAYTQCLNDLKFAMQATQDAFELDHPEVFWHRSGRTWKYRWNFDKNSLDQQNQTCTFYIYSVTYNPVEIYSGAIDSMPAFDEAVQSAKNTIEQMASSSGEDEEWAVKYARAASLYLAQRITYGSRYITQATQAEEEEKASGTQDVNDVFSIYNPAGAFLDSAGTGTEMICEGYAKAFKILCDKEGIPCILICGVAGNTGHMWNAIESEEGIWYFTDPTWCDAGSELNRKYFMVTKNQPGRTMSGKRTSSQFSPAFVYPALSEECYSTCHQYMETANTDATCTIDGEKKLLCEWCHVQETVKTQSALGHNYVQTQKKDATCEENGFITSTCTRCMDTVTDTIPAKGHSYQETERKDATCTQDGYVKRACSNCKTEIIITIPKTGHSYKITSNKAPTCDTAGQITYTCDRCFDSYSKAPPASGHLFNQAQTVPPTCTQPGYTRHTCTKCGTHYDDTITAARGHSLIKTSVTPATETTGALETDTCAACGYKVTKIISEPLGEAQIIKKSGLAKAVTLKKVKRSGKKIKVTWSYAKKYKKKATSYEIQISSSKQFHNRQTSIVGKKKTSSKISVPGSGTYYVRIRAINENGHSAWSKTKKITIK